MTSMRMDEIFGLVDQALENAEKASAPRKRQKPKTRPILPKMNVKRSHIPEEMKSVDVGNVVYVPDSELRLLAARLNVETKDLSKLLIRTLMPKLLAYQTSLTYTQAALKEGLDVEVDFDSGLAECVKCIGYLDIVFHFLKGSKIPTSMKRSFGTAFAQRLANFAVDSMVDVNKSQQKRQQFDDLQAVVYSHREKKMQRKSIGDRNVPKATAPEAERPSRPAVRRSRSV